MTMSILAWTLETTRPAAFVLLLALLPVAWFFHRSLVDLPPRQRVVSLATRCCVLLLLILAAAGINLIQNDSRQFTVFLLDHSDSLDDSAATAANKFITDSLQKMRRDDEARMIEFAGNTSPPRRPGDAASPGALDRGQTDIAHAISTACASIPVFYAKNIVLLSDGRATRGDALEIARTARESQTRICTVPLHPTSRDEVQLSQVNAPAEVRAGAPFELQVDISSTHEEQAELEVYLNDIRVGAEKVDLKTGDNHFSFRRVATPDRLQTYSVRVKPSRDHFTDNNTASALVSCQGKPRVLLVESTERDARYLTWALEKEDMVVDVRGPRGVPQSLADLENFELLILSNVPATDLTSRQMQLIRSYVQDLGGGLIMIGGDHSFGLGGYYKTVIEEILPVRSDFEKEKEKPSLAMVLVIDKSGSMGGQKMEMAKDAAKAAVELLGPRDQAGVIAFDGAPQWVCTIHPVSDRDFILERISSLIAGGGTNMAPALSDAYSGLNEVQAKLKHVIALTDGISQPGNFFEIINSMVESKITCSTVAVGNDADKDLLTKMAEWGQGRAYIAEDPNQLPQIFARETMEASKSAINEQPFLPVQIKPHQICQGLNLAESPFLLGYVITERKPTAEVVLATEAGHPLLATWRYGLGKSLAFTSDAKNRWSAEWLQWAGFSRFWSQVVRDTMRTTTHGSIQVDLQRHGDKMAVAVDAMNPSVQAAGEYLDGVKTVLEVIRPASGKESIPLEQVQPGRYTGQFSVADQGSYHVRIAQSGKGVELQSVSRGVAVGYSDEYRVGPIDEAMLRQIAQTGGGVFNPAPADVFQADAKSLRLRPLSGILISLTLLLLILDVALRRIDFSLLFGTARSWPGVRAGQAGGSPASAGTSVARAGTSPVR